MHLSVCWCFPSEVVYTYVLKGDRLISVILEVWKLGHVFWLILVQRFNGALKNLLWIMGIRIFFDTLYTTKAWVRCGMKLQYGMIVKTVKVQYKFFSLERYIMKVQMIFSYLFVPFRTKPHLLEAGCGLVSTPSPELRGVTIINLPCLDLKPDSRGLVSGFSVVRKMCLHLSPPK